MHTYTPTSSHEVEAHESKQCTEWCIGGGGVRSPVPGLKTQTLANSCTGVVFTGGPLVRSRHLYFSGQCKSREIFPFLSPHPGIRCRVFPRRWEVVFVSPPQRGGWETLVLREAAGVSAEPFRRVLPNVQPGCLAQRCCMMLDASQPCCMLGASQPCCFAQICCK